MTTTANIPGMQSNAMTPLFSDTGRLLAWLLPAGALDMPWQSNPLQSSGRTVPEQCQNSGMFTDYQYTRSQQDALLPFVHYYNELKDLVDQLFPSRKKQRIMANEEPKGGVSAERVATDPNFERTRENAAEFAAAGKAAYLLRSIFRDVTVYAKDKITQARLLTICKRVLSTDGVSNRGERSVANGDHLQFKPFNFTGRAGIRDTLYVPAPLFVANCERSLMWTLDILRIFNHYTKRITWTSMYASPVTRLTVPGRRVKYFTIVLRLNEKQR